MDQVTCSLGLRSRTAQVLRPDSRFGYLQGGGGECSAVAEARCRNGIQERIWGRVANWKPPTAFQAVEHSCLLPVDFSPLLLVFQISKEARPPACF